MSVVRREPPVVECGWPSHGFPTSKEGQANHRFRKSPEALLDRYGGLDQFSAPAEVTEGPNRIPFSRPRRAIPLRRKEQHTSVFDHAPHLTQRRFWIGDVFENPYRPRCIKLIFAQR